MIASGEVLRRLEWQRVAAQLATHTRTPMGAEAARTLVPGDRREALDAMHARVEETRALHAGTGRLPIVEVQDPAAVLRELQVRGRALPGREIYETLRLLQVAREVAEALRELDPEDFERLGSEWARFPELGGVIGVLEGNITSSGELEDHASPELARLRREIRQLSDSLQSILQRIVRDEWGGPVLRDKFVTMRNERFVVPVRTDAPRRFDGIVHATSATDRTAFVEPMETVEINNRLVRLREDEKQEVDRILLEYTEVLRAARDEIAITAELLGELDLLEAVAAWAEINDAVRPELVVGGGIRLEQARHPGLEESLRREHPPRAMVPIDVDLPRELRVLVISGPNAGGKTVSLKTVGLLSLMAHAGLPLPAKRAQLPFFEQILADIGDEQSIEGSLSTFSSHVRNLVTMEREAGPATLCLVDEIGTGTDPAEGAALGTAVLDRLRQSGAHVVATTHHQAVKTWAYRTEETLNAACAFDESTMRPTYRLVPGVAGSSVGLTMAEQLGLSREVVEDARARLDPSGAEASRALESVRALAGELEERRAEIAEERRRMRAELDEKARRLEAEEARRKAEWEQRVERLTREFRSEASRSIERIESRREQRKLDLERARQERALRERFSEEARAATRSEPPPSEWSPREGELVLVASLGKEGRVKTLKGNKADVLLGRSAFTVPLADLRPVKKGGADEAPSSGEARRRPTLPGGVEAELSDRSVPRELQLIGMRVDEALPALDKYLDDAALAGLREVRIVHGFGTGRLKTAVRAHLAKHADVLRTRDAAPNEGGGGATLAVLEDDPA